MVERAACKANHEIDTADGARLAEVLDEIDRFDRQAAGRKFGRNLLEH